MEEGPISLPQGEMRTLGWEVREESQFLIQEKKEFLASRTAHLLPRVVDIAHGQSVPLGTWAPAELLQHGRDYSLRDTSFPRREGMALHWN